MVHFWLHHAAHCTGSYIVSVRLHMGSTSAERVGLGEVGGSLAGVVHMAVLGLAVKGSWLAPGGPIFTPAVSTGLENATLTW